MHRIFTTLALLIVATGAKAEVTGNIGFLSDYIYRGVPQASSVANGGLDWSQDDWYLGTWAAAVKPGLEVDVYGGYKHTFDNDLMLGAGFTLYYYSDDFDDTYKEVNLYAGYKFVELEYTVGDYENFTGPTLDYDFIALTGTYKDFYAKFGTFGKDFDGEYLEVGYGISVAELDLGLSLVRSSKELAFNTGTNGLPAEDTFLVISISKSFGILD